MTYYKDDNGVFVQTTIGPFYTKDEDSYLEVYDRDNLDPNTTYYKLEGDNFVVIPYAEITLSITIYTKNAPTYTQVPISNLVSSGTTYYYHDSTNGYVQIDNISDHIGTVYTKNADRYTAVTDLSTLNSSGTTYYKKIGENNYEEIADINTYIGIYRQVINYNYTPINFYKFVHYDPVIGASTGASNIYLFSGLNGKYSTPQESDLTTPIWEANVHKERVGNTYHWVPYKSANDGWRAEIINTNVNGGTIFPVGTKYLGEDSSSPVTGYVHNCWEGSTYNSATHKWSGGTKVPDYTPSLPEY